MTSDIGAASGTRNPFSVRDVPVPNDADVQAFAETARLGGDQADENAANWASASATSAASLEGRWCSRWNGGADPTIAGDAPDKWKQGAAEFRKIGDRVYLLFDWEQGRRRGLIDAHSDGRRLVGKYVNLTSPEITCPWIGLIVDHSRIDGLWTEGRLDFRRLTIG